MIHSDNESGVLSKLRRKRVIGESPLLKNGPYGNPLALNTPGSLIRRRPNPCQPIMRRLRSSSHSATRLAQSHLPLQHLRPPLLPPTPTPDRSLLLLPTSSRSIPHFPRSRTRDHWSSNPPYHPRELDLILYTLTLSLWQSSTIPCPTQGTPIRPVPCIRQKYRSPRC
jgi:hypothetical protein